MATWHDLGHLEDYNDDTHDTRGHQALAAAVAAIGTPAWHADAACREHDPAFWFAPNQTPAATLAKAICSRCLVRDDCAAYAEADPHLEGIWAGLTRKERTGRR